MPKTSYYIDNLIVKLIEFEDITTLTNIIDFDNSEIDSNLKLQNIDLRDINISVFYKLLKISTREEQLNFFKDNIKDNLTIIQGFLNSIDLSHKSVIDCLYYDSIKFLIDKNINILKFAKEKTIAESRCLTLDEKIKLLEEYYLKINYQKTNDYILAINNFYSKSDLNKNKEKNQYLDAIYENGVLDDLLNNIKELNEERISLSEIMHKIFMKKDTYEGLSLLNKYDEKIKQKLLKFEKIDKYVGYTGNLITMDLFFKKYYKYLFVNENLDYGITLFMPFFNILVKEKVDILKKYPFLISKILDNENIKKIILKNTISQAPLIRYYLETKGNYKEITNYLHNNDYFEYLKYFELLEKKLKKEDITLEKIKNINTIFCDDYIKLLAYLNKHNNKELFDFGYQLLLHDVIEYITIKDDEEYFKKILRIYYKRCINGFPLCKLLYFNNELELCVHKRFNIEMGAIDDFKLKQIMAINAKEYLKIIKDYWNRVKYNGVNGVSTYVISDFGNHSTYPQLLLCGLMVFPFDKLKKILNECQYDYRIMELLFDSIDKSKIKISKDGKIEYNQKLINLFFGKENGVLKKLNAENIIVKNFANIYNNWDKIIKFYPSQKLSLSMIKSFVEKQLFQSYDIGIEYFDLKPYLFYIGNSDLAISNIKKYYLDMKMRYYATIPQVKGEYNGYHYEMLNTNDPLALAVGKLTNCCFRIDGHAKTAVHYTMLNPDNRIFCVWKDNVLIAQSWVWRNGNVVCFDNIECIKNEQKNVDEWFNCYLKATEEIYKESFYKENETERIKMITLGRNSRDVKISSLNKYIKLDKRENIVFVKNKLKDLLPKIYTDAGGQQVVLHQEPSFLTKDNYINTNNIYLDSRSKVKQINNIDNKNVKQHIQIINALIGKETPLDSIKEGEVGNGWYHYKTSDNKEYSGIFSYDPRAYQEYELSLKKKFK